MERRLATVSATTNAPTPSSVTVDEILEAAWPGERMAPDAAANRLHVALATLRKLGLRDALKSGGGAYWLDPSLALRVPAD